MKNGTDCVALSGSFIMQMITSVSVLPCVSCLHCLTVCTVPNYLALMYRKMLIQKAHLLLPIIGWVFDDYIFFLIKTVSWLKEGIAAFKNRINFLFTACRVASICFVMIVFKKCTTK